MVTLIAILDTKFFRGYLNVQIKEAQNDYSANVA